MGGAICYTSPIPKRMSLFRNTMMPRAVLASRVAVPRIAAARALSTKVPGLEPDPVAAREFRESVEHTEEHAACAYS